MVVGSYYQDQAWCIRRCDSQDCVGVDYLNKTPYTILNIDLVISCARAVIGQCGNRNHNITGRLREEYHRDVKLVKSSASALRAPLDGSAGTPRHGQWLATHSVAPQNISDITSLKKTNPRRGEDKTFAIYIVLCKKGPGPVI